MRSRITLGVVVLALGAFLLAGCPTPPPSCPSPPDGSWYGTWQSTEYGWVGGNLYTNLEFSAPDVSGRATVTGLLFGDAHGDATGTIACAKVTLDLPAADLVLTGKVREDAAGWTLEGTYEAENSSTVTTIPGQEDTGTFELIWYEVTPTT